MKFIDVLKKGRMLSNPVTWKRLQAIVVLIGGIAPLIVILVPSLQRYLSADVVAATYAALGSVGAYLTVATTEKMGL